MSQANSQSGAEDAVLLSAVEGNTQWLDGGAMFGNVPRAMWETWLPPDAQSRIQLSCRAMLIEYQGKRLLCETGIGAFFEPKLAERFGVAERDHKLLASLNKLGLSDSDIDFLVLSHLHFDHAGGLLPTYAEIQAGNDRLLFPKARYLVGREAFERAKKPHPRDRASFIPGLVEKLENSGRLILVDGEKVPADLERVEAFKGFSDRLSFRYSHGHTPGQMHAVFRGLTHSIIFAGDLIPGTPWVHVPVTMGYDRNAELVIDEKQALYDIAVPNHWLLFYTHDTKTAASEVSKDAKGRCQATGLIQHPERLAI